ncbi:MAG: DUF58 domain-containing protein [Fimbriimonadaceae bacterium]
MRIFPWIFAILFGLGIGWLFRSAVPIGASLFALLLLLFAVYTSRPVKTNPAAMRSIESDLVPVGGSVGVRTHWSGVDALRFRWVRVDETLPDHVEVQGPTGLMTFGGGEGPMEFVYTVKFPHRGVHALGPSRLAYGDMFGLSSYTSDAGPADHVFVHPKVTVIPAVKAPSARLIGDARGARAALEDPTLLAGCRPYVAGDPLKRVHWPATARTGRLTSRIYDVSSTPVYTVWLDTCAANYAFDEQFELACQAAASLACRLSDDGLDASLECGGHVPVGEGRLHRALVLRALASAKREPTPLHERLLLRTPHVPWRATLILVTGQIDLMAGAALDLFRKRGHSLAVVAVGDALANSYTVARAAAMGATSAAINNATDLERLRFIAASER